MKEKPKAKTSAKKAVTKTIDKPKAAKRSAPKAAEKKEPAALINLSNLPRPYGSHKKRKYLGRGSSSGHGKTSTRGSKGQTSRAGRHFYLGFEGGQSPLVRKMPKRGFVNTFRKVYQVVNLEDLNSIKEAVITPAILETKGLVRDAAALVKILGKGSLKNNVTVQAHAFSKRAQVEITNAGGKAEIIKF